MSQIYNTNMILSSNKSMFDISTNKVNIISEEISFFKECLEDLLENDSIITSESFSDFLFNTRKGKDRCVNFFSMIKNILSKIVQMFKDLLEKLWNKFKALFVRLKKSEDMIGKYAIILKNYQDNVLYSDKRMIFTNIDNSQQFIVFQSAISDIYMDLSKRIFALESSSNNRIKYYDKMKQIKDELEDAESILSDMRGKSIGLYESIAKEAYSDHLFRYFRNGGQSVERDLTPIDIQEAYENYCMNDDKIKNLKEDKDRLSKISTNIVNDINKISIPKSMDEDTEIGNLLRSILQDAANKVNNVCNIYSMFFTAKMDAIKEYYIQNKNICLRAIEHYISNGGEA